MSVDDVTSHVAAAAGIEAERASGWVDAFQRATDRLVSDDWSVIAPPLLVVARDDPVATALLAWIRSTPADDEIDRFWSDDLNQRARVLDVDVRALKQHPIAFFDDIVLAAMESLDADEAALGDRFVVAVRAWVETFAARSFVARWKPERELEDWLVDHLDLLVEHGYAVELGVVDLRARFGRQLVLSDRSRPDLVCRATGDVGAVRAGDWLVIELKAVRAHLEAVTQLAGYVQRVAIDIARGGERVHGLLIAPGAGGHVRDAVAKQGLDYLSTGALGYAPQEARTE